ncbi:hypothetical protein BDV96DRAFT_585069 [Lophiotrema nucula]|uniref:Uncharacterized protein n=1 Tax=Lophiotrema nucula TaxID=690887 RepID=A0A6A5YRI3_9PLEO|nr:hypothetical protein BDV96DRAFT_585069 [Lophiotrema nucula]
MRARREGARPVLCFQGSGAEKRGLRGWRAGKPVEGESALTHERNCEAFANALLGKVPSAREALSLSVTSLIARELTGNCKPTAFNHSSGL